MKKARRFVEQEGISHFRKQRRLRAFKLIDRESKGLQRKSKDLEGIGKGPRGTSILDPPQGGFYKSQSLKRTNTGLHSLLDMAFLEGWGSEERFLTLQLVCSSLYFPLSCGTGGSCSSSSWLPLFSLTTITLLHCPLAQQPHSLSLLRQSHGTSQTVSTKGQGTQGRGKGQV